MVTRVPLLPGSNAASTQGPGKLGFFNASDGWRLGFEAWPAGKASNTGLDVGHTQGETITDTVLFLHGVNASADTVQCRRLASAFQERSGVAFVALDHHAHGSSTSKHNINQCKGLIEGFPTLQRHAVEFGAFLMSQARPGARLFLIGHSMGGATAFGAARGLRAAVGDAFQGLVLIAPSIALKKPPAAWLVVVMGLLKAIGLGFLPLGPKDETSGYTPPDSEPVGVGRNYPGGMRVGTAIALVRFAAGFGAKHERIALPSDLRVLLVTGEQDEVVDVARVRALILSLQHQGTIQAECWSLEGHSHSPVGDEGGSDVARKIAGFFFSPRP